MKDPEPPTYRIVLRPTPGGPPPIIRLRRFLKAALRGYGLRCLSAEELPAGKTQEPGPLDDKKGPGVGGVMGAAESR